LAASLSDERRCSYVNIGQKQRTREELVALMKERLRPIPPSARYKSGAEGEVGGTQVAQPSEGVTKRSLQAR
jgi:hypothetical protein